METSHYDWLYDPRLGRLIRLAWGREALKVSPIHPKIIQTDGGPHQVAGRDGTVHSRIDWLSRCLNLLDRGVSWFSEGSASRKRE